MLTGSLISDLYEYVIIPKVTLLMHSPLPGRNDFEIANYRLI